MFRLHLVYLSGAPAGYWGNHGLRSGMWLKSQMMKYHSRPGLWTWPVSMVGMGIAGSRRCFDEKVGGSITNASSGSGDKKG